MKRVAVREFKNRATQLLRGEDVLLIQRHGKDVGVYVPWRQRDVFRSGRTIGLFAAFTAFGS